ncbi:MAG: hypothetical protein U0414_30845, partial [Polyangiaceae bacterium]
LPKPKDLVGRVVVLDVAFASEAGGASFEKTTLPFIEGLGPRLRAWVDHHDSAHHARFAADPRFILTTKAEHGACPEMITPELVARVGEVETIACHNDFDGLASAAKWIRAGVECYPGCDDDARAVDTRTGKIGPIGVRLDRALRARPRDAGLHGVVVRHLSTGLSDASLWGPIDAAARELIPVEEETRRIAAGFVTFHPGVAYVDATDHRGAYDKTLLLLLGQERAEVSVVTDQDTVSVAAPFDSGRNFLDLFGLSGGMPTRVSLERSKLGSILGALGVSESDRRAKNL